MDKANFKAGETTGQVEEKGSQAANKAGGVLQSAKETTQGGKGNQAADKTGGLLQSAKETVQGAGAQIYATAAQATEAVKNATGMNKK